MQSHALSGKVVLVTGASRGLGRDLALRLRDAGARVHAVARHAGRRRELAAELGELCVHGGDLNLSDTPRQVVQGVLHAEGALHALVHAVGEYEHASLAETGFERFEELMASNLFQAVRLVDAARDGLREVQGQVLFYGAAGLASLRGRRSTGAYTTAKTALLAYMRSLALEEAPHGVRVNMVSPGIAPHEGAAPDTLDPGAAAWVPMGRTAELAEVTGGAMYLLGAAHVTGQNLEVAGGFLL
ncbi:MAG: SDR family oxidoreductase [Planctomycetota bacterium]